MAVIDKSTKQYYKIDFEESCVKGLNVYPAYVVYPNEAERIKEKNRQAEVSAFCAALFDRGEQLQREIEDGISAAGLTAEEVVGEDGYIRAEFPELRDKQAELEKALRLRCVPQMLRIADGEERSLDISADAQYLSQFGFKREWTDDPVRIKCTAVMHCGEYGGEAITPEMYYERIKPLFVNPIENV